MKYLRIKDADFSANAVENNYSPDFPWVDGYVNSNNVRTSAPASIVAMSVIAPCPLVISTKDASCGFCILHIADKKWNDVSSSAAWIYDTTTKIYVAEGETFTIQCRYTQVGGQNIDVERPYSECTLVHNIIVQPAVNLMAGLSFIGGYVDGSNAVTSTTAVIVSLSNKYSKQIKVRTTRSNCGFAVLNVGTKKWNNNSSSAAWIYDNTEVTIPAGEVFTIQCRYAPVSDQAIDVETPYEESVLARSVFITAES